MSPENRKPLVFKRAKTLTVAATLLAALVCFSCGGRGDGQPFVRLKANSLQIRTTPPGSSVSGIFGPALDGESMVTRWEFDIAWDSAKYLLWVTSQLEAEFKVVNAGDSRLVFAGYSDGDAINLDIKVTDSARKMHVSVTLVMYPD